MAITIDGTAGITMPAGGLANTAGAAVGTSDTQTLTNKTIQGGTLTLGTAQNTTSGTAIDFTGIPSWVKRITVVLSSVSTNGTANVMLQLGTSGGFLTTGYLGSTMQTAASSVTTGTSTTGIRLQLVTGATSVFHALSTISRLTGNTWVASGVGAYSDGAAVTSTACTIPLAGTLDRLRLTTTNGTDAFDAGSVNIMYEG